MSLLDRGNADVLLYPEEVTEDMDGNIRTQASDTPIPIRAYLWVMNQSGTASRRAEQDNEGFAIEKVLSMRPVRRDQHHEIGAQAKIQWGDEMYSVFGEVSRHNMSPSTTHYVYTLRRS